MNPVILAVAIMLGLSLARFPVVPSIIIAAVCGGLWAGMPVDHVLSSFHLGIKEGANIALSYAMLGAFAAAIAKSGIPHWLCDHAISHAKQSQSHNIARAVLLSILALAAVASQNLIPIHIAFIPILVPPMLYLMSEIGLDRRLVACTLTFGLVCTYMFLPIGFGEIYLKKILLGNIKLAGLDINEGNFSLMDAMWLPALGMLSGLLVAATITYRKPRTYNLHAIEKLDGENVAPNSRAIMISLVALITAFAVQLTWDSMILGALVGFMLLSMSGSTRWRDNDSVFVDGMKMMANIGFIMIAASGFAEVLRDSGSIPELVKATAGLVDNSPWIASFAMLLVGLVITMGIGSSFSTIPIIATIYVPIAQALGFSPLAIVALVGTAGVLGDAGSPASDSTLGPTAGLNADGQHDHIRDTVVPTFIHYNLPLLLFGWIATLIL
ncbi:Uncharacterised protein [BD1-7 clade bacterium]|uniref:Na+/H+ antiporter NhaC-like C-terminal domain-containing protein n=1 Tax=BD1-7 clade bacterium TaxID=2029982 RepID=A0A5S9QVT5_9GAMM|nr:Uncharacterised protein [BD1-7 clade bacterium]CAA0122825.1 Uncharacterised protein [BD1-7 clade bacterium]